MKYDKKSGLPILGWRDAQRTAHYLRNEAEIQEIGSMLPDFIGGISTGLTWKNWNVRVGLDMRFGGYVASYNSRYGTAYGFTENSLKGRPGHGGVEWTSKYDGIAYRDGVIPNGILPEGTKITQPDKSVYTVGKGGVSDAGDSQCAPSISHISQIKRVTCLIKQTNHHLLSPYHRRNRDTQVNVFAGHIDRELTILRNSMLINFEI